MTTTRRWRWWRACALAAALGCLLPSGAQAAGFAIGEQGAASGALAGAATARTDLAEAGFYNPSAFALGPEEAPVGVRGALGATLLAPTIEHTSPDGQVTQTEGGVAPIPRVHIGVRAGSVAANLSVSAPFGSSVQWPPGWAGRYELTGTSLQVLELGLGIAWRPVAPLAIAVGPRFQSSSLAIGRRIDVVDPERQAGVDIQARGAGVGAQAALTFAPIEQLSVGLSWRSRVAHQLDGAADFTDIPIELEPRAHDTPVSTRLVMPGRFALGAAGWFDWGIVSADIEYTAWQSVDALVIDFEDEQVEDVTQPRDWSGALAYRLGYELRLLERALSLRAGASYEATPVPTATLGPSSPDGPRVIAALGAGYQFDFGMFVNLSGSRTWILEREVEDPETLPGRYGGQIWALGADVGFRIGEGVADE